MEQSKVIPLRTLPPCALGTLTVTILLLAGRERTFPATDTDVPDTCKVCPEMVELVDAVEMAVAVTVEEVETLGSLHLSK